MKTVLVLGDKGFLGNAAASYFSNIGYNVKRGSEEILNLDLTLEEQCKSIIEKTKPHILLQFAASTTNSADVINAPWVHVTDNAVMNSYIFKHAVENNVEHVLFPSCTTMYPGDLGRPVTEADFDRNKIYNKYFGVASTKVYIEDMCKFWSRLGNTTFTVIRHSNIYGPGDRLGDTAHVCGATIRKVLQSSPDKPIEVWGNGTEIRDLLFITDLLEAVKCILERKSDKFGLYNLGSGKGISVKDLTLKIRKLALKEDSPIVFNSNGPTLDFSLVLDSSKFADTYNWKPDISLTLGLELSIAWAKRELKQG